jgi:ATP-dependent exoDNAse (exonuclease V) beta subunit
VTARIKTDLRTPGGAQRAQQLSLDFQPAGEDSSSEREFVQEVDARGTEWGEAAHLCLHAAARGISGDALRLAARNALLAAGCPTGQDGEPTWLQELIDLVEGMRASDLWNRAAAAQRVLFEVAFELPMSAQDWSAMSGESAGPATELVVGRIDLAFQEHDGWVIADYKTDVVDNAVLRSRVKQYRRQVDAYAQCWSRLTGAPVKERRLVFTAQGVKDEVW